jgi:hypothetical protein
VTEDYPALTWADLGTRLSHAANGPQPVEPMSPKRGDPEPQPSKCHENAAAYVEYHLDCRVVRGWLVSGGVFDAHSVVELPDGRLIDPTPLAVRPPFLRHPGPDSEFDAILAQRWNQIVAVSEGDHHPTSPDNPWPDSERLF